MKNCKGSIDSIESMSTIDGPGLRTVIFLSGCKKRCLYCHNPEMWKLSNPNYTPLELYNKIKNYFDYYGSNGGVTFSGGEPLLQSEFLLEICKLLKKDNIHIALDTAGYKIENKELFNYIDLIILDIKHVEMKAYYNLVKYDIDEVNEFIKFINTLNIKIHLRQVVVPGIHDNEEYINKLVSYVKQINNVEKITFIPYHKLGDEKYKKLGIVNPLDDTPIMDINECDKLYKNFLRRMENEEK